jgi:hypothetical protein
MIGNSTLARLRRFRPDTEGVTLHVGCVREISANGRRLDVAADPIDEDPNHDRWIPSAPSGRISTGKGGLE